MPWFCYLCHLSVMYYITDCDTVNTFYGYSEKGENTVLSEIHIEFYVFPWILFFFRSQIYFILYSAMPKKYRNLIYYLIIGSTDLSLLYWLIQKRNISTCLFFWKLFKNIAIISIILSLFKIVDIEKYLVWLIEQRLILFLIWVQFTFSAHLLRY